MTKTNIQKLTTLFASFKLSYDVNELNNLINQVVFFISYVGEFQSKKYYKFEQTKSIYDSINIDAIMFSTYDIVYMCPCNNTKALELVRTYIGNEGRGYLLTMQSHEMDLFAANDIITIENVISIVEQFTKKIPIYGNGKELSKNAQVAKFIFDTVNHMIKYGNKTVKCFVVDGKIYFKGNDVAGLLGYKRPRDAVKDLVREKNKISVKMFICNSGNLPLLKSEHPNTILITESGMYQLIMRSKLEITEDFQDYVTDELLPSMRLKTQGVCLPTINQNLLGKNKQNKITRKPIINYNFDLSNNEHIQNIVPHKKYISPYTSKEIAEASNRRLIYMAYIGVYNEKDTFKYGRTDNINRRVIKEHRKKYKCFELMFFIYCENDLFVENEFKKHVEFLKVDKQLTIKGNSKDRELFTLSNKFSLEDAKDKLIEFDHKYPSALQTSNNEEIKSLQQELKVMNARSEYQNKLLKSYEDTINILKNAP